MAACIRWCIRLVSKDSKLSIRDVALFGVLAALTFGAKMVMSMLPNIEPVSLMIMIFAVVFGKKGLYPMYVYVALEFLFWGFGLWNINYLYVWLILFVVARLLRNMDSPIGWAILSGTFGLCFGALCGIVDIFIGSWSYAVTKWVAGLNFDLWHCAGNFAITLFAFKPMRKLTEKLYNKV